MAFAEQFGAFFDVAQGFAVSALYNGATTIDVIFDKAWFEDRPGEAGIGATQPMALAIESDVPSAAPGNTLVIGGTTYTVTEVHPDGTGLVMLLLRS
jgi:hypothetical protein